MGTIENGEFIGTRKNRQNGGSCRRCHVIGFILNASGRKRRPTTICSDAITTFELYQVLSRKSRTLLSSYSGLVQWTANIPWQKHTTLWTDGFLTSSTGVAVYVPMSISPKCKSLIFPHAVMDDFNVPTVAMQNLNLIQFLL